jgi:hypothetical protein
LQEANVEVKNVADWTEELDEFFKRQKEASSREEEKTESLEPIAREFLTTVEGTFTELKQGLEKLGKKVETARYVGGDSIKVFEGDAEEISYGITAEVARGSIMVRKNLTFTSKRDGERVSYSASLRPPTDSMSASELKGITKKFIIESFLREYKEAIGYTTLKGPKPG